MKFTKMEGCGNDYVYINCFTETVENPEALAVRMSNRNYGVGSDGLILILPDEQADLRMRMFNADGSESEMCGNGVRCVGKYAYDHGLVKKTEITINTGGGIKALTLHLKDGVVDTATVDMGEPILEAEKIPVASSSAPVCRETIEAVGRKFLFTCVSMGNPHAVTVVEETAQFPVMQYGSVLETDSHFPQRANIEFIELIDRSRLKMRVWERGSGETLACGTGACAAAVAAILDGLCDNVVTIELLGGELVVEWNRENNRVYMTGPARYCFDGIWLKDAGRNDNER